MIIVIEFWLWLHPVPVCFSLKESIPPCTDLLENLVVKPCRFRQPDPGRKFKNLTFICVLALPDKNPLSKVRVKTE